MGNRGSIALLLLFVNLITLQLLPSSRLEHVKRMMAKILTWNSFELEARIISLNATAAIVGRSQENFLASEHGKIASTWPFVEVVPAPVSTPEQSWPAVPWSKITKPGVHGILHGVKVVELTRILLGPRTGCLLAALGASVVRINSPRIAEGMLAVDVNVGHLSFHLDLRNPEDKAKLDTLLEDCDVFISNNTPGVVDKLGLSLNDLLKKISGRNKGLVYAEANAFGHAGPYAKASGYEQLGQFISGLADTHGKYHKYDGPVEEDRPALVPINGEPRSSSLTQPSPLSNRPSSFQKSSTSAPPISSAWASSAPSLSAPSTALPTASAPPSCKAP